MNETTLSPSELEALLKSNEVQVVVSSPLKIRITPQGALEILCYQQIGKSTTPLQMKLCFQSDAAGQLVSGLCAAVESGAITIEAATQVPGLQ